MDLSAIETGQTETSTFCPGHFLRKQASKFCASFSADSDLKNQFFVLCRFEQSIQLHVDSCVHCHTVTNVCDEIRIQSFHMVTGAMLLQLCFFLHFSQKLFSSVPPDVKKTSQLK